MDLKKAQILLGKINILFQSMNADTGGISPIEKDLMRSYLRDLYEVFYEQQGSSPQKVAATPPPPVEEVEVIKPPKKVSPPPAPKKPKPRVIQVPTPIVEEPTPKVVEEIKPSPPPPRPIPKPSKANKLTAEDGVSALFDKAKAKELSDKLSEMPIPDLTKAMGLNEKIFTINELFGGDQDVFDEMVKQLNKLDNFDDAKIYLEQAATEYGWDSKNKSKKARNFIKLVRRRYV